MAVSDITALKRAEEAQRRMEALAAANRELKQEIVRRKAVEEALKKSEQHSSQLLAQSRHLQEQLRHLSRQVLPAQEEERKRISRELHDEIAQILTGINVHLATLKKEATANPKGLKRKIARTQRLVEKSVDIVHRFARELRPPALGRPGADSRPPFLHEGLCETDGHPPFTSRASLAAGWNNWTVPSERCSIASPRKRSPMSPSHAQASRVKVSIQKLRGAIRMEIKDNGKSFQVERVLSATKEQTVWGCSACASGWRWSAARFTVESAPGQGHHDPGADSVRQRHRG